MSLIVPHNILIQGHSRVPYLWRIMCSCGWKAIAPSQRIALEAKASHLSDEEPFPDLSFLEEPK